MVTTPDPLSTALIGRNRSPRYQYGEIVTDAIRGDVIITRTSDAPIPWPLAKLPGGRKAELVVFKGLEKALRTESASAVCHHWGITPWTVFLGIDQKTAGARLLRQHRVPAALVTARALVDMQAPERRQKISDAKKGKPRPKHVIDALRALVDRCQRTIGGRLVRHPDGGEHAHRKRVDHGPQKRTTPSGRCPAKMPHRPRGEHCRRFMIGRQSSNFRMDDERSHER